MAGETWRQLIQVGLETTPGTPVAATRRMYLSGTFKKDRAVNLVKVATGTRDNQVAATLRAIKASGTMTSPIVVDEAVEYLLAGVDGGVTPVENASTGQYDWEFLPGENLDSQTWEWQDGYNPWQLAGTRVDALKMSGKANGDSKVDLTLFAQGMEPHAVTPSLVKRSIKPLDGSQAKVYIDAFGGTAGTTNVAKTVVDWQVELKNNSGYKYFCDNTPDAGAITIGDLSIQAQMTFEGNANALAEYQNWENGTPRLIRVELGNNGAVIGSSTVKPTIWIDMPAIWTVVDLTPEDAGTKVYKLTAEYQVDPTNGFGIRYTVRTGRSTAY